MPESDKKDAGRLSRRGFLKGVGGTVITTAALGSAPVSSPAAQDATTDAGKVLKGAQKIRLRINGETKEVEVEPRTTLLATLRDRLQLTGTKEVCDRGSCGACTVIIDGKTQLGCLTLAVDARDKDITTIEGLVKKNGELSDLQQAFVDKDGLMCGFCTPGFVMSAEALLRDNPNPTRDDIRLGVSGNLCRCGTYPKVFEAIEATAAKRKGG